MPWSRRLPRGSCWPTGVRWPERPGSPPCRSCRCGQSEPTGQATLRAAADAAAEPTTHPRPGRPCCRRARRGDPPPLTNATPSAVRPTTRPGRRRSGRPEGPREGRRRSRASARVVTPAVAASAGSAASAASIRASTSGGIGVAGREARSAATAGSSSGVRSGSVVARLVVLTTAHRPAPPSFGSPVPAWGCTGVTDGEGVAFPTSAPDVLPGGVASVTRPNIGRSVTASRARRASSGS